MMNQLFYIAIDGQQQGPFTIEDLKIKGIQKNTLVWTDGLSDWTKAEDISLLKDILGATPPPLPNTEERTTSQQVPSQPIPITSDNKYFGYELASRRERLFASLIEGIIIYVPCSLIYIAIQREGVDFWDDNYDYFSVESFKETVVWAIFAAILGMLFYPIWSGNLGHKLMGLKIISSIDGKDKNSAGTGALREFLKTISGFVILPVIWLLWDDDKQNLYDKFVGTYVVKHKHF